MRAIVLGLAGLVVGVGGCAFVVDRAATLDADETKVLGTLADELSNAAGLRINSPSVDRSPCWWWCEDYQLTVRLTADVVDTGGRTQAEVCRAAKDALPILLGPPSRDDVGRLRFRECYLTWNRVRYDGRLVSVALDVSTKDSLSGPNTQIMITNDSASRAFLPYGSWKDEG